MILFIDELHTIVGAGAAEGSMDAANLLKPALARGERLEGLTVARPTLEDVYLELTAGQSDEVAAAIDDAPPAGGQRRRSRR